MKRFAIGLALGAALLSAVPALAATTTGGSQAVHNGISGGLTLANDAVVLPVLGTQWASVKFSATTAGTATVTAQVSVDGGVNFVSAAYAKRIDTAASNPTVQAISATTLTAAQVWEVVLPANATHFQLLCAGAGTTTTVSLQGSQQYTPGVPVLAVLYDVTSGTNAALDTGTVDVSGWRVAEAYLTFSGGTSAFTVSEVDDAGTSLQIWSGAPAAPAYVALGEGLSLATLGSNAVLNAFGIPLPRRVRYQSGAIAANTSRIRVTVRR